MKLCQLTSRSQSKSSKAETFGIDVFSLPLSTVPTNEKVKCKIWLLSKLRFFLNSIAKV